MVCSLHDYTDNTRVKIYRAIGINIYKARLKRNLTQTQLAERAEISLKYIQNLESKSPKSVTIATLMKIAHALDIEIWKLFKF